MRILFISSEYPPETGYGGIGTYCRFIAETLALNGHNVFVISRSVTGQSTITIQNGVEVHRIPILPYSLPKQRIFYPLRKLCYKTIPNTLNRIAWAKSAWTRYEVFLKSPDFDIIEYPECGAEGYYFSRSRLPSAVRLHTPWSMIRKLDRLDEHPFDRLILTQLEKITVKNSRITSSPSHALANLLKKEWNLENIAVYPNPIPIENFSLNPNLKAKQWIYTGRIEYRKGTHLLLDAYARLSESCHAPPLLLIGRPFGILSDGTSYEECIARLIEDLGIAHKVTWIKGVPQNEISSFLQNSSVAFFPSLWENFPYTCLEAMASGIAVCASDCGGYPEMVDNQQNGLLFKTGDVPSLVSQMTRLLQDCELVKKLGKNARIKVNTCFDSNVIYQKALNFYQTIQRSGN